ncbi:hypothetical protein GUJ93_ZPchr0013g34552 [Zizania palustris]|uniref:Uncharacterized protein n=1 Tax=Zizania palustris TaxID=103762 RepID=A0A8J5X1M3_ZIZPA|nr:hypothetical protein GUJ93_ZPchr0013g34552 [Zizania palustris]
MRALPLNCYEAPVQPHHRRPGTGGRDGSRCSNPDQLSNLELMAYVVTDPDMISQACTVMSMPAVKGWIAELSSHASRG